jgi:four helix bundle protein
MNEAGYNFARRFEDLQIWQKSKIQVKMIYSAFKDCRDYAFRDQIQRSALSVMSNIAEGFERHTDKDFAHFLDLAKGSCGEVRSLLYAAEEIGLLSSTEAQTLRVDAEGISKQIAAFTRHLRKPISAQ